MTAAAASPWYCQRGKRMLDLVIGISALLLISPFMLVLACAVGIFLGRPVLFRQQRPGLNGGLFILNKFRTMTEGRDPFGKLLPDERRLTPFGRFLRSTSLDELPELFNVLKGEMSLVGPRPLLPEYLDHYTAEQARRHRVRPGITGWAQINGRNALDWEQKLALDVWYVDHLTCWLDLRILARTIAKALSREGISSPGHATMHEFHGRPPEPPRN